MPFDAAQNRQGYPPAQASVGLLIIDMINPFEFAGADRIVGAAARAAEHIATLKRRAKSAGIPTLYVNDNFGSWRSDFRRLVERCTQAGCRGRTVAELLVPEEDDYFVLKPKHSAFYATPLELLLRHLRVQRLIITGVAGDSCVLYTASDAYMRDFQLIVPADCTASVSARDNTAALAHMERMLKADIRPSAELQKATF